MPSIRIVVGRMPRLLREIVINSLSHQEGLEVVDATGADLRRLLAVTAGQVLVLSGGGALLSAGEEQLLRSRPRLCVLVLDPGGRQAALYESEPGKRPRRRRLPEVSMEHLVAEIRAYVDRLDSWN